MFSKMSIPRMIEMRMKVEFDMMNESKERMKGVTQIITRHTNMFKKSQISRNLLSIWKTGISDCLSYKIWLIQYLS